MSNIMNFTPTVIKNLFSKPVTVNYPAEPAVYPARSRGHVEIDISTCVLCGLCGMNCPSGAIKVDRKAGTWSINRFDCIQCGYCTEKCNKKSLSMAPGYQEPMGEKGIVTVEKPKPAEAPKAAEAAKPVETVVTAGDNQTTETAKSEAAVVSEEK